MKNELVRLLFNATSSAISHVVANRRLLISHMRVKLALGVFVVLNCITINCTASTYYIDYVGGSDANNGTSTSTPWKFCPIIMTNFSGSYTHSAGDRFIFKGGVTWPYTVVKASDYGSGNGMQFGGTPAAYDYYGVSFSYYSGSSWSQPVFDGGGTSGVAQLAFQMHDFNNGVDQGCITVDNIQFLHWGQGTVIDVYKGTNEFVANCLFTNWVITGFGSDAFFGINGNATVTSSQGTVSNCVFDGAPNNTPTSASGYAMYHFFGNVLNCTVAHMANGFLPDGGIIAGCNVGPIYSSFSGVHENGIESEGSGTCYWYNNIIHDTIGMCMNADNGQTAYIWNNLIYNNAPIAIQCQGSGGTLYVYNNTVVCPNGFIRSVTAGGAKLVSFNNHVINGSINTSSFGSVTELNDLAQTLTAATAAGYTSGNNWQPANSSASTVGIGTNLTSLGLFTNDLLGNARPSSGAWDVGAYEYATNVVSLNIPVISLSTGNLNFGSTPVNQTSNQTFSVHNIGGGVLTGTAAVGAPFSMTNGNFSLAAGQSQLLSIQFAPNTAGAVTNVVTFTVTGGSGTNALVYGIGSASPPPTVSAISANASDVDQNQAGLQIYSGTVVSLSATASNALTYQWSYTVNGGSQVVFQGGSGSVSAASFSYGTSTVGNTYVWTLSISNSQGSAHSQFTLNVESPPIASANLTFAAQNGSITAPFVFGTNGTTIYFYQPVQTVGINGNGIAIYNFTITNAGNYEVQALVNAPNDGANSLYVNIDAVPQDPGMTWDIVMTSGFEGRLVSWRGTGTDTANQFVPWIFPLTNGLHQILFYGREANTQVAGFSILPAPPTPPPPSIIIQ